MTADVMSVGSFIAKVLERQRHRDKETVPERKKE
jgi:hypothetical protein